MSNAKEELLELLKEQSLTLECAAIEEVHYSLDNLKRFHLLQGYNDKALADFLDSLDFQYDDGFGSEYLGGTLWFTDGTWADRGTYDGSEWWEYHKLPEIPEYLKPAAPKGGEDKSV